MNYWKRYAGDYLRDTGHLSLAEHGAYNLLLDIYYSNRKPVLADVGVLCRLCRARGKAEHEAVAAVAGEFFPVGEDGQRHNKRADEELAKWDDLVAEQSRKGKLGGRPGKKPGETPSLTGEKPELNRRKAGVKPELNRRKAGVKPGESPPTPTPERTSPTAGKPAMGDSFATRKPAYPDEFESAWADYPRRDGDNPKHRAFRAWKARIAEGHTALEIHAGVTRYAAHCRERGKIGSAYVKQAATFFGPDKAFLEAWKTEAPELPMRLAI